MFYPSFYFDPTYILIIIGVIICSIASMRVKSTFSKYSGMRNHMGLTGAQAQNVYSMGPEFMTCELSG